MILEVRARTTAIPEMYAMYVKYRGNDGIDTWWAKSFPKSEPLPWCIGQLIVEIGEASTRGWVKQLPPMS